MSTIGMMSLNNMFDEDFNCTPPKSRRDARETALQVLYALELSGSSVNAVFQDLLPKCQSHPAVLGFARNMVKKVYNAREQLDDYIQRNSANWRYERIAIIDLIIMRLAICEFMYFAEIPPKVSIDEALELAKNFSTKKSSAYINGMLDAVLLELKEKKLITKKGRGKRDKKRKKTLGDD